MYVGIDWSEARRTAAIVRGWASWTVRLPMCEPPLLSKEDTLDAARTEGLTPPRLYELGCSATTTFTGLAFRSAIKAVARTRHISPKEWRDSGKLPLAFAGKGHSRRTRRLTGSRIVQPCPAW